MASSFSWKKKQSCLYTKAGDTVTNNPYEYRQDNWFQIMLNAQRADRTEIQERSSWCNKSHRKSARTGNERASGSSKAKAFTPWSTPSNTGPEQSCSRLCFHPASPTSKGVTSLAWYFSRCESCFSPTNCNEGTVCAPARPKIALKTRGSSARDAFVNVKTAVWGSSGLV
jgi:hypothetical protein